MRYRMDLSRLINWNIRKTAAWPLISFRMSAWAIFQTVANLPMPESVYVIASLIVNPASVAACSIHFMPSSGCTGMCVADSGIVIRSRSARGVSLPHAPMTKFSSGLGRSSPRRTSTVSDVVVVVISVLATIAVILSIVGGLP